MVKLPGLWNLLASDLLFNNTLVRQTHGPNPLGKILITTGGYMSVLITTPNLTPLPKGTAWQDGADADVATIAREVTTYCGKYKTSSVGQQLLLTIDVDVAMDPAWIGKPQTRNVSLVEENGRDYMILTPQQTFRVTLPVSFGPGESPAAEGY
jgi:hypothetical protein